MRWRFWIKPETPDPVEVAAMRKRVEIADARQRIIDLAAGDTFARSRGYGRARPRS